MCVFRFVRTWLSERKRKKERELASYWCSNWCIWAWETSINVHSMKRCLIWKSTTKVGYLAFYFERLVSQMWRISTQFHLSSISLDISIFDVFYFLLFMHFDFISCGIKTPSSECFWLLRWSNQHTWSEKVMSEFFCCCCQLYVHILYVFQLVRL